MIADVAAYYDEQCTACGARFRIDRIVSEDDSFRLHVSVESLLKSETLDLLLDGTRVVPLAAGEATEWANTYSWNLATGTGYPGYRELLKKAVTLRPVAAGELPMTLGPGQRWEGWLEVAKSLPEDTAAFIPTIGPLTRDGRFYSHNSHDPRRPFVSLGEEFWLSHSQACIC